MQLHRLVSLEPNFSICAESKIDNTATATCVVESNGSSYLGSVGILACVGHGNDSGAGVVEVEVLVLELFTVNRSASSSIATSKVTL